MRVRRLLASDRKGLLALLDQSYEEVKKNSGLGECLRLERPNKSAESKWFSGTLESVKNGDDALYVAEEHGNIIGFCAVYKKDIPDSEMSHVGMLGMRVAEGYRGRGIGTKLIKKTLSGCAGKFDTIELFVFKSNEDAQRLYRRFGFKKWGTAPGYIKRGKRYIDLVYMCLKL